MKSRKKFKFNFLWKNTLKMRNIIILSVVGFGALGSTIAYGGMMLIGFRKPNYGK